MQQAETGAGGASTTPQGATGTGADPIRGVAADAIDVSLRWHMVRTAPRLGPTGRKTLDEALSKLQVPAYRPRASEVVIRRQRRTVRHVPLLIRAVVIGVRDEAHLGEVGALPGIAEIVSYPVADETAQGNVASFAWKPARLDPKQLQRFIDALARGEIVKPVGIEVGQSVVVMAGPFASFPAVVEQILHPDRVKVAVSIFGRPSPVELGIAEVQAV